MKSRQLIACALALAASAGCADSFPDYNQVTGFRLLGMRADTPTLADGESSQLSALVTETGATYAWSWCPLTQGQAGGYACAISHDQLQAVADQTLGAGQVTVPPYDLGSGETATFAYPVPPELLAAVCDFIKQNDVTDVPDLPSCDGRYEIKLRLETSGSDNSVIGVRDVDLLYQDGLERNANPTIAGVVAVDPTGAEVTLDPSAATQLQRDVNYTLRVDVGADQAETYMAPPVEGGPPVPTRENLFVTWFYEAGAMDRIRTSYLQDSDLANLRENHWRTPTTDERTEATTTLWFVIRDDRGGISWITRTIGLVQP